MFATNANNINGTQTTKTDVAKSAERVWSRGGDHGTRHFGVQRNRSTTDKRERAVRGRRGISYIDREELDLVLVQNTKID